jgi:hypothetical protein
VNHNVELDEADHLRTKNLHIDRAVTSHLLRHNGYSPLRQSYSSGNRHWRRQQADSRDGCDDTFIASAGLAEFGAFDPREIALQAIKDSRTLVEARVKFEQQIEQPLVDVLTKLRARNRERYEAFKKGAAVNMIFARFNDEPELVGSALTPKDEKDGSISLVKNQITLMDVQKSKRIFVGVSKRTEMILDRPSLWSKGTVAGVQRVLEMSIEDNKEAGGPIDIVQITKGGVRWFPREPECDSRSRRVNDQPSTCNSARH